MLQGGGLVVLDKECRRHLSDEMYYRQLPPDPTNEFPTTVTAELILLWGRRDNKGWTWLHGSGDLIRVV